MDFTAKGRKNMRTQSGHVNKDDEIGETKNQREQSLQLLVTS